MNAIIECKACGQKNRLHADPTKTPKCGQCHQALPWVVEADQRSFQQEVTAGVPVLVDFWAEWCPPCRAIAPVLEELAGEYAGRLKVVKVNVDENSALAQQFRAMNIPLLVIISEGKEASRIVGALPKPQLKQRLTPFLTS